MRFFEIWKKTDQQTDEQTNKQTDRQMYRHADCNTLHPTADKLIFKQNEKGASLAKR